ncbi:hypothetical protein NM688_g1688 [Phlebia brevispora]|uniref:Uncharacterized protein n=1 Tax=Phlebia brevispora TaxID=194682 RepID=A0ACC1TAX6_9APHY|nr:hypothetical protein NM688_g1688 [Phlebia brevispora]
MHEIWSRKRLMHREATTVSAALRGQGLMEADPLPLGSFGEGACVELVAPVSSGYPHSALATHPAPFPCGAYFLIGSSSFLFSFCFVKVSLSFSYKTQSPQNDAPSLSLFPSHLLSSSKVVYRPQNLRRVHSLAPHVCSELEPPQLSRHDEILALVSCCPLQHALQPQSHNASPHVTQHDYISIFLRTSHQAAHTVSSLPLLHGLHEREWFTGAVV